jgi:hypothetical protein
MIQSAEEFVLLRDSEVKADYDRATMDEAPASVWLDVIERYPIYRKWVAQNKTVPLEVLETLCEFDKDVRVFVAMRRRLSTKLFQQLSKDPDPVVRQQIAANAKAPLEVLNDLAADVDEDVARVAKSNLGCRTA